MVVALLPPDTIRGSRVVPCFIAPANASHLAAIARLHRTCIDKGFLSTLGDALLMRLYEAMLACPTTHLRVALRGSEVVGFIAVTENTREFYRWTLRHRALQLGLPLMGRMLSLARLRRVAETLLYPSAAEVSHLPDAELLSMAVSEEARGLNLGRRLVESGLRALAEHGVEAIRVACADILESNGFYRRLGFELAGTKEHHGLTTNLYVRAITTTAMRPIRAASVAAA
jgi:ribosomal protein S18 acetylase RimI-like enzyme